jgi:multidrug efflux pump subunit AcrA (membrane-fusion protein)
MGTLEVEADVAEANIGRIRVEQPVEITLDALPELRLSGRVARIVPTVDRAKATVMTKVRFDAPDPRILPEMSAKVSFLSQAPGPDDARPVTAVNPKTVVERDGRAVVFRIRDDTVEVVPVTRGRTLGDALEVSGGALAPGQRLVLSPPPGLAAGARVTVVGR